MAEVATKKSINVVSSKKSEVCGVQSNNGLIDLDNLTASNNQLISLCDNNDDDEDDLILTKNTHNEFGNDEKSLQELIENELAIRICSSTNSDDIAMDANESEETIVQPETIKRIVLDRRQDDMSDINTEFIVAESQHYFLIEESHTPRNGHMYSDTNSEGAKSQSACFHDQKEEQIFHEQPEVGSAVITQKTNDADQVSYGGSIDRKDDDDTNIEYDQVIVEEHAVLSTNNPDSDNVTDFLVDKWDTQEELTSSPVTCPDKCGKEQEKEQPQTDILENTNLFRIDAHQKEMNTDVVQDIWTEETPSIDSQQTGQFSDNFDEALCRDLEKQKSLKESSTNVHVNEANSLFGHVDVIPSEKTLNSSCVQSKEKIASMIPNGERSSSPAAIEYMNSTLNENLQENPSCVLSIQEKSENLDDNINQSEIFTGTVSTEDFLAMERRVLNKETDQEAPSIMVSSEITETQTSDSIIKNESVEHLKDVIESTQGSMNESSNEVSASISAIEKIEVKLPDTTIFSEKKQVEQVEKLDSWITVEEATKLTSLSDEKCKDTVHNDIDVSEATKDNNKDKQQDLFSIASPRAPLATPDDETSDVSNAWDSERREETVTTNSSLVTSSKGSTKTKKKKIEGVAGNDASSPNLTPRTKKTKKSKKSDLEKENISVNCTLQDASMHADARRTYSEMIYFSDKDDLSNVNVKSLTQNYVSETSRSDQEKLCKERIATGVSIKQLCRSFGDISNMSDGNQMAFGKTNYMLETEEKARSMGDLRVCERDYSRFTKDAPVFAGVSVKALKSSFNKFDALTKKTILHVRSVDAGKVQQQLNVVGQNGDANSNCRSCGKVVFQMEQTKAEGLIWHKNCFRCVQCSKQLNMDNYESHESTLYCKPHFKELFQPKPVEESDQSVRPRKPELIIRENEPKELPPDVVRASDKPDLGLEELSSLNVKSRFQVFEKANTENVSDIEKSPSQIAVKRSPSILSKLAKFQAKGMDIGVADESLNGIPYEESSESEEEVETEETEDLEPEIVKSKRITRERPISFSKMDDIKNRWESTSQQGRREVQREARKEEIAGIRSRLFMGKQGKMKEMYQQAVAGSDRVTKINAAEEIQHSIHARSIKERFERGEPIGDDETDNKPKPEKADEEVIAAGIGRKSRSLFLELDASAAKTGRPMTPVNPRTPTDTPRRARDAFMARQVSDDVVRSSDTTEEVHVETSDISNKFKFFESYKEPEKQRKQFRITPPRDGQVKMDSPDREIYRDPEVVRADDRINEVVHTDTARKMLSIFRQMEENASKEEVPEGPKPLKRFTPPPEDKFAKATASDSEEDEDEEGEDSDGDNSTEEKNPNYVRASDKVEDEFLKQAQNAARAKTLRAKFEHWEEIDGKVSNHHVAELDIAQGTGDQSSIESASSLRARFESLGSQSNESPRTPKVKVNRFVEIQTTCADVCESCQKKVYPLEKIETNNKIFHKQCFRCLQCNCILRMDSFTLNNGKLYCIPHFKQLFITRGNYDEGFGVDPHKNKWTSTNPNNSTSSSPISVSNGDF